MPPLSSPLCIDLTEEVSDNDEIEIIEVNNYKDNKFILDLNALTRKFLGSQPPPILYNDLNVERKNKNGNGNENDDAVIVTKKRKPTINQQKTRKKRRLQKIEQWIKEDNDEYLTEKLRKLLFLCPICQDPLSDRNPTSTPCGHIFCGDCLLSALI
eukprot:UN01859